jgi:hypothetical protein
LESPQPPPTAVPALRAANETQDRQLHLAHAEQELIRAAEQLAQARRILAALSPALSRNYLAAEKRRLDAEQFLEIARFNFRETAHAPAFELLCFAGVGVAVIFV